jgi:hypothetical protein
VDLLPLAWLVITVLAWGAGGFGGGLTRDASFYVYAGQQVAAGNPPYVEVMNRAGPFASLLPGLGIELGRLFGITDAMGARLLFFVLAVLTPPIVYLTARDMFGSRLAGCGAATTMLGFGVIARLSTSGPESKVAMVTGLSIALLLLVRRRWLLAGIATGLVTLTWQPVLFALAPAAALLVVLSGGTARQRVGSALRYGAGGLLTLAVTVVGFALAGATQEFVQGFWSANAKYTKQQAALERPWRVWDHLQIAFGWTFWLLVIGSLAALALGITAWGLRRTAPRRAADQAMLAVACLGGLVWVGWFAFDRAPDSMPLLPAAALGMGGIIGKLAHLVRRASSPWPRRLLVAGVAGWTATTVVLTSMHTYELRSDRLTMQTASSDAIFDNLPEDATVFSYEVPQPLALSRRKSISRFVLFDHGMRDFIDAETPGGKTAYVDGLIEAQPDVVLIANQTPFKMVRPLLPNYVRVGYGPSWKVFLHEDIDVETQKRVAEALVASRLPFTD